MSWQPPLPPPPPPRRQVQQQQQHRSILSPPPRSNAPHPVHTPLHSPRPPPPPPPSPADGSFATATNPSLVPAMAGLSVQTAGPLPPRPNLPYQSPVALRAPPPTPQSMPRPPFLPLSQYGANFTPQSYPQHPMPPPPPQAHPQQQQQQNVYSQQRPPTHMPPPPHPSMNSTSQMQQVHQTQQHQQHQYPTTPQAGYNAGSSNHMSPPNRSQMSPAQAPHPPLFMRPQMYERSLPVFRPRVSAESGDIINAPPPADSRFIVQDDGNASPDVMRSTVYAMPMTSGLWSDCGSIDLGILCQPLAVPNASFVRPKIDISHMPQDVQESFQMLDQTADPQAVPLEASTPRDAPPRCRTCQAYINPFWDMSKRRCNLCGSNNSQLNTDQLFAPLQKATVDYCVGGPYVTRSTPVQPVVLYALDLTCPAIKMYLQLLHDVVVDQWVAQYYRQKQHAQTHVNISSPKLGVVFVGSSGVYIPTDDGGFVNMPDVSEDPYCPLPIDSWAWDVGTDEGLNQWRAFYEQLTMAEVGMESLLHRLVRINQRHSGNYNNTSAISFKNGQTTAYPAPSSCGGAAMAFLADALQQTGGRAVWISWQRPNHGIGAIINRETSRSSKNEAYLTYESSLYIPLQRQKASIHPHDQAAAEFYTKLGLACAKNCVAMEIVLHPSAALDLHGNRNGNSFAPFLDLATLGELCRVSGGRLVKIASSASWKDTMARELVRPLVEFSGWDAIWKIRVSNGLSVKNVLSDNAGIVRNNLLGEPDELEINCVTPDTSIATFLTHRVGGVKKEVRFVFIQSALLYTDVWTGERRVRVSTLALRTTAMAADVYRSIDFCTMAAFRLRFVAGLLRQLTGNEQDGDSPRIIARNSMMEQCIKLLVNFRKHVSPEHAAQTKLLLPEKLQLLPLFTLSLLKSPILRPSHDKPNPAVRSQVTVEPSPNADDRAYHVLQATAATPAMAVLMVHPNLFPIGESNLVDGVGDWQTPPIDHSMPELDRYSRIPYVHLPPTVSLSMTNFEQYGLYLLDTMNAMYLFAGRDIHPARLQQLEQFANSEYLPHDSPLARIVWQIRQYRKQSTPLYLTQNPEAIRTWMVCDVVSSHEPDYGVFVRDLYRQIKTRSG